MATKQVQTTRPKVTISFDYLSINFGQGRVFTLGRSGEKGTNIDDAVFNRLLAFIDRNSNGSNYDKAINALADQIDTIWPEWNTPAPTFSPGDRVEFQGRKGTVIKKARVNINVQFDGDRFITGISPTLIKHAQ